MAMAVFDRKLHVILKGCDRLYTIDEVNEMLDEIAEELPEEVFRWLNGGVSLVAERKLSKADPAGGLYTLGEYRRDQMGRYIVLYYGSICTVHGHKPRDGFRESLKKLLAHELTHHLESLAGERDLEIKDESDLADYLRTARRRSKRVRKADS